MALSYVNLQKLMLPIKQCLKPLDAFCFSSKDKIVLLAWHSGKVLNPIIISNSIQVVNVLLPWKRLIVSSFPYKYVLWNISRLACSRMVRVFYSYISVVIVSATLPRIMSFASSIFPMAISTPFRLSSYYCSTFLAAIRNHIMMFCSRFFHLFLSSVRTYLSFRGMVIFSLSRQSLLSGARWAKLLEWFVVTKRQSTDLADYSEYHIPIIQNLDKFVNREMLQC